MGRGGYDREIIAEWARPLMLRIALESAHP